MIGIVANRGPGRGRITRSRAGIASVLVAAAIRGSRQDGRGTLHGRAVSGSRATTDRPVGEPMEGDPNGQRPSVSRASGVRVVGILWRMGAQTTSA